MCQIVYYSGDTRNYPIHEIHIGKRPIQCRGFEQTAHPGEIVEYMKRNGSFQRDRCDGCGTVRGGRVEVSPEGDDGTVRYCTGCDWFRRRNGIDPGDHRQYELRDELEEGDEFEEDDTHTGGGEPEDADEWREARGILHMMKGGG